MKKQESKNLKTLDQITEDDRLEIAKAFMDQKFAVDKQKERGFIFGIIGIFSGLAMTAFCLSFLEIYNLLTTALPFDIFSISTGVIGMTYFYKSAKQIEKDCCNELGFLDVKTLRKVVKSKEFAPYIQTYKKYHPELLTKKERKEISNRRVENYVEEFKIKKSNEYDQGYRTGEPKKESGKSLDNK